MIDLKSIKTYYLNADTFTDRRARMDSFLTNLGFRFERVGSSSSHQSRAVKIAEGLCHLVRVAVQSAEYPFLILEDDAEIIKDLPAHIEIPEDAVLIYLGASLWNCGGIKPDLKLSDRPDSYYRLHHSLATHAILVPNEESAKHFIKILSNAIDTGEHTDILFAVESANSVYLTPKDGPYFYQNDPHTRPITEFQWLDHRDLLIKKN
jgi:hypothetical protein